LIYYIYNYIYLVSHNYNAQAVQRDQLQITNIKITYNSTDSVIYCKTESPTLTLSVSFSLSLRVSLTKIIIIIMNHLL